MSRSLSNITDITKLMDECKAMGIQTLGPDVNESNLKFTVNHDGNIRFGLGAVKGVGEAAVQSIVEERNTNGPFKGIFDFVQRVNLNACNKKNMECLALAGGFDSFPELKREQYFAVNSKGEVFLETLMRYGNRYQEDKRAAINSLFGGANVVDIATPEIPQGVERWGDLERLNKERDLVGIYLSAHPLDEFAIVLDHVCNTRMADLEDKAALAGREITMGGIVTSVRRGISKNGNPYGIAKIEDVQILDQKVTAADGTEFTVEREDGDPQVGDKAYPNGTYVLEDGTTIVVADETIESITPAGEGDGDGDGNSDLNAKVDDLTKQVADLTEKVNTLTSEKEALATDKANLESKVSALEAEAKTEDEKNILAIVNKAGGKSWLESLKDMSSTFTANNRKFVAHGDNKNDPQGETRAQRMLREQRERQEAKRKAKK